jgi:hypothetical protein
MTMRYAHLSPEHLERVVTLNPISKMQCWTYTHYFVCEV